LPDESSDMVEPLHGQSALPPIEFGDIGFLDPEGQFRTIFNIFLDFDGNRRRGYQPPPGFVSSRDPALGPLKPIRDYLVSQRAKIRPHKRLGTNYAGMVTKFNTECVFAVT